MCCSGGPHCASLSGDLCSGIEMIDNKIETLHKKLTDNLNSVKLGVAGRLLYFDAEQQMFILGMHSMSPEKTDEATSLAWSSIPEGLKAELKEAEIGFAGKQI